MIPSLLKSTPHPHPTNILTLILSLSHLYPWVCISLSSSFIPITDFRLWFFVVHYVFRFSFIISFPISPLSFLVLDFLIDLGFYGSRFFYTSGFSEMESPSSCLSWLSSSQDSDLVGPPNSWFDLYLLRALLKPILTGKEL